MADEPELRIDVWSDFVCPFCYLEIPVLDRLQEEFGARLQIHWRAYELRPEPAPTLDPSGEYLRSAWANAVYPMAAERGMTMRLPPVQPRSRKALEAAAHARSEEKGDEMRAAIFRAFFEEGKDIGQIEVLLEIADSVGLKKEPLRQALKEGRHTEDVLEDQQLAYDLGLSAVPTMLIHKPDTPMKYATPIRGALGYKHVHAAVEALLNEEN